MSGSDVDSHWNYSFFIGLFDRYYHWKNEEENLTSALGIELQSPDAFSNA
jgi:hypothetical protein